MSAPTLRAMPKTTRAVPSAGSTGRRSARESSPTCRPAAGPTESGIAAARTATSTRSVASATPHVPTVSAITTDRARLAAAPTISSRAIYAPAACDQVLRQHPDRLVNEQDEREQRQDGRRAPRIRRRPRHGSGSRGSRAAATRAQARRQSLRAGRRAAAAAAAPARPSPRTPRTPDRAATSPRWRDRTRAGRASKRSRRTPPARRRARSRRRRRRSRRPPCSRRGRGSCSS